MLQAFPKIVSLFDLTNLFLPVDTRQGDAGRIIAQHCRRIVRSKHTHKMKRLSELEPGTIARIHSFEKNDLFLKLMEMGCLPGEEVRISRIAPLGDPIAISVSGYQLSLRRFEASTIILQ